MELFIMEHMIKYHQEVGFIFSTHHTDFPEPDLADAHGHG